MSVYDEIRAEREHQDATWGGPEHDDFHKPKEWQHLIFEWLYRANVARVREQHAGWRKHMVQVAALAVAAVESYDRRHADDGATRRPATTAGGEG